ncbi:MAG TPA: GAF domain-containing protein [Solirubrobacteraceae bacterium]|nr:GAF domain-containing protein [Solirubrobacteraceae bacterium]
MTAQPGAHIKALDGFVDVLASIPDEAALADGDGLTFYGRLCAAICELSAVDRAVIFRYDAARRKVRAAGAHGIDISIFEDGFYTVETLAAARQALAEDHVVEITGGIEVPEQFAPLISEAGVVVTPIAAGGRWMGVVVADRPAAGLSESERDMLWVLGKTAALAATARIATFQAQRARELEARLDMAREIHDGVIQRLFGVSLALSGEGALDEEARARCSEELQTALVDLRVALQRPLGRESRPTQTTLADELRRLGAEHPDLGVLLEDGDPAAVPAELEPLAQSVLTEAVRNAHRHARPTSVRVRVGDEDGAFVLEVRNDGVGERARRVSGMGLRLAALEALQHGGILEFGERAPGEWQVRLVVSGGR